MIEKVKAFESRIRHEAEILEQDIHKCSSMIDFTLKEQEYDDQLKPLNIPFLNSQLRTLAKPCMLMLAKLEQQYDSFTTVIQREKKKQIAEKIERQSCISEQLDASSQRKSVRRKRRKPKKKGD